MAGGDSVAGTEALQARIAALESELEQAKSDLHTQRGEDTWFKGLVEIAPDAMLVHDADRKIIYINPAGVRLFGANSVDRIIGTLATSFIHPDSREATKRENEGSLGGAMPSRSPPEQRRLRLDGTDFYANVTATAIIWNDKPATLVVVRDISGRIRDRKKYEAAEKNRRETHARLLDAIEAMPEGFALFDADDRLQIYNRQYAERFSGIADDFIQPGVTFNDIVAETVKSGMLVTEGPNCAKQAQENHRNLPSQQEVEYRSGHWVRRSKKRTRDGGVVSVYTDITELKAREQALKDSERRYRKMIEVLPCAVYERVQSPTGKISFSHVSADVHEFTGLTAEEIIEDASVLIKSIRADFRDRYRAHFQHSAAHMAPADIEFPMISPDGNLRWLHSSGRPQHRADGSIVWDGIMIDVTEKKIVQEIAERNHQWLLQAIGSMPIGFMLWDPDDRLVLWNERVSNYHPDPTMFREGLFFEDLLILPYQEVQSRSGRKAADEWLAERRRQHEMVQGNYEFQGIEGQWFVLSERRTVDGFTVTMLLNVTDRHESERRLQESEERYRAMINLSPDAIYVHKLGNIAVCNEAAVHMFGASSADDLIGRELLELTHPDHHDFVRERRSAMVEEGTRTVFMRQKRVRLDGSWFWAEVAAAAIAWEGERGGVVVIRDVTAQTAAEEELIRSKEVAELANRAKTEFLANISHELRTPLNAIVGFSDLMQREMLGPLGNEQYASYVRDIYQSGTHLHDVINDILDLSKIEAGQMELRETSVDVRQIIERCIRVVATRATDNGLKVITDLPDTMPFIIADERKLKQILINLMSNAVKFTEKGGTVTIEATSGINEAVTIRVTDTGIGIAAENLAKVFRPFEQVDGSLTRSHEGTGLGLSITKSLVELHGGTFGLESELGVGTIATVTLPAARRAAEPIAAE